MDSQKQEQIATNSIYFGLSLLGRAVSQAASVGNRVAQIVEPAAVKSLALIPFPDLKRYLKSIPDPILRLDSGGKEQDSSRPAAHLYQIRNQLMQVAAMGLYSLPIPSRAFFDIITPARRDRKGAETDALKAFHIYSSGAVSEQLCFSFAGASWLFLYELGVAIALQECVQAAALQECHFMGCSTASFIAACLALEIPIEKYKDFIISTVCRMSRQFFGPIGQCSRMWSELLQEIIKQDIGRANNRLFISLTKIPSMENLVSMKYKDKQDLINHVLASCYMPILFETPVKIGENLFVNGTFKNTISTIPDVLTITVSPDAGEANICPSILRYTNLEKAFPPQEASICEHMINDGFKDAKKWLSRQYHTQVLVEKFFQPHFKSKFYISNDS